MIDIYLNDKIDIVTIAADEWGKIVTTTQQNIDARIEDTNKLIRDKNGQEVVAQTFLIVSESAALKYESKIMLKSINGVATQTPNKEFVIKKLMKAHSFMNTHWEVWL